jgi:asparagine synthase (glutamine-hydrolysing)
MCGIVGVFSNKTSFDKAKVREMLNSIAHRGPDDSGIVAIDTNTNQVGEDRSNLLFGHRRLSILDLSSLGHQPMATKDKKIWITYNGEIFNFIEIRENLRKKGYGFTSNTDTEVILYAYKEYGHDCIKMFRGFFAFCIYDFNKQELFLARDRLGSKPLKYFFDGQTLAFSSEIQALLKLGVSDKEIDYQSVSQFLSLKYVPAPRTIFKDIKKLPAGNFMIFNLDSKKLTIEQYWQPEFEPKIDISYSDAKYKTKELLKDAINIRMISDVPVGVFLSGGIDSSAIVALLAEQPSQQINTFSVGFSNSKFDERPYAQRIAKKFNTNHTEFLVEPNLKSDLEKIVTNYDEPFADPSMIPTYYLSKEVSSHVKVVLGGDGADEMLSGYKRYAIQRRNSFLNYLPNWYKSSNKSLLKYIPSVFDKNTGWGKVSRLLESLSGDMVDTYYLRLSGFSKKQKYDLFGQDAYQINQEIWGKDVYDYFSTHLNLSNIDRLMAVDQITHLPEYILAKSDISGMANGLEVRTPFIDVKVVEWINKLDSSFKNKDYSKRILKDILRESGVDQDIVHRKKAGFTPPLRQWMKDSDSVLQHYLLSKDSTLNFLDANYLRQIYNDNLSTDYSMSNNLFTLLVLGVWLEKNI